MDLYIMELYVMSVTGFIAVPASYKTAKIPNRPQWPIANK